MKAFQNMEKKFFSQKLTYLPASLVRGKSAWYIKFYQTNPATGDRKLFRWTYDLNRIKNKRLRLNEANRLIAEINLKLPDGYPFTMTTPTPKMATRLMDAIEVARKIKCDTDRFHTRKSYNSAAKVFLEWAASRGYTSRRVGEFVRSQALEFMDFIRFDRKASNGTYNNYLIRMNALFNALLLREYILANPFQGLPEKRREEKKRRPFTKEERDVIIQYVQANDFWLYVGIVLQFYCYIRPIEIARLKFSYFHLVDGYIELPGHVTKNKKSRNITIPLIIMPVFLDRRFSGSPTNYYLYGRGLQPYADMAVPERQIYNRMYKRHKAILKQLKEEGKLKNIDGLTWYSWKDTGMTESEASIFADMHQAGHSDPRHTLIYKRAQKVNEEIRHTKKKIGL